MQFEEREFKPYAEPVTASELKDGEVYFSVTFVDDDMTIPVIQTLVFIGRNMDEGDADQVYFQDIDSYQQGVQHGSVKEEDHAVFVKCSKDELSNVFEYEHALEVLMRCSIRRRGLAKPAR